MNDIFTPFEKDLSEKTKLFIFDIESITPQLEKAMDECLVSICKGTLAEDELAYVKKDLQNFMQKKATSKEAKRNYPKIMGAIAEFYCHLFFKLKNYQQEFTFRNLEENSVKKGFDGYYLDENGESWIMESKSGYFSGNSHDDKVKEAVKDLNNKFLGKGANNPWTNAYNHTSNINVNAPNEIRGVLKNLEKRFIDKDYPKIDDFNIIPCGTIYLDGNWIQPDANIITEKIKGIEDKLSGKKRIVICITNNTIKMFCNYLGVVLK